MISSLASCLCVVGCGLLPESCSYTLFTGPAVCCAVFGNRVCTTLDTANKNCAEANSLLRLQVDSKVLKIHDQLYELKWFGPGGENRTTGQTVGQ